MAVPSQRDQRLVDDAVRSVQSLPSQAVKVQNAVVPQANPARKSLDEAVKMNDELFRQASRIVELMSDPGTRFVVASRGHEGPDQRMYGRRYAELDSMDRFHDSSRRSRASGLPFRDSAGLPNPDFVVNLPAPHYAPSKDEGKNKTAQRAADEVRGWLTPEFLGDSRACAGMNRSPPVFTVENREFFSTVGWRQEGESAIGFYFNGSNHLALSEGIVSDRTKLIAVAAHEQLHYASWLGGGHDIRWMDENQKPTVKNFEDVRWFHEGMTEHLAQQLVRSKGYTPDYVAYPAEVLVAAYIGKTLEEAAGGGSGAAMLRTAYTTGDFTKVRTLLDSKLGKGSFDMLLRFRRGADALAFLEGKIPKAKRDSWDFDPIAKSARSEADSDRAMDAMKQYYDSAAGMSKDKAPGRGKMGD